MRGFLNWLSRLGRVAGLPTRVARQSLLVERLEPRQMLAVDCFFMVEIRPVELESGEQYSTCAHVDAWQVEHEADEALQYAWPLTGRSILDEVEEYYLILLEDVLEDIGELFEGQETAFGDFDDLNFSWFS
jgi:hypothetical protein